MPGTPMTGTSPNHAARRLPAPAGQGETSKSQGWQHQPSHAPLRPPSPSAMPPTLVMLASEQSGDGHSQCAKPFTSTQEAPNSQLISSQDLGADGSGGGREGGKGDKKHVPTLKQTDKQSQEAMLDPTPSPFPGTRQSSTSVPMCPQHLCPHVSPWAVPHLSRSRSCPACCRWGTGCTSCR